MQQMRECDVKVEAAAQGAAFRIRLADSEGRRAAADGLVGKMYARRGYDTSFLSGARNGEPLTLVVSDGGEPLGTLTLRLDSPAGLSVDELYPQEVGAVRVLNRRVCELVRLAIEPGRGSKPVLAALFHTAYIYGRLLHGVDDVFIEVNPRHVAFYRRMLGFRVWGPERTCPRVNAPAVLLRLELAHVDREIDAHGGRAQDESAEESARSLYSYFFSPREAAGIAERLRKG